MNQTQLTSFDQFIIDMGLIKIIDSLHLTSVTYVSQDQRYLNKDKAKACW